MLREGLTMAETCIFKGVYCVTPSSINQIRFHSWNKGTDKCSSLVRYSNYTMRSKGQFDPNFSCQTPTLTKHFSEGFISCAKLHHMEASEQGHQLENTVATHLENEEEYASLSKLLQEFTNIPSIDKAWIFKSENDRSSRAMFSISQPNLLSNRRRTSILTSQLLEKSENSVYFHWSPFPIEMEGVSTIVPSPSGLKLLIVRNAINESPTHLEIWNSSQLQKEIYIPSSVHGSIYTDGWFEGISWNDEETHIAYIAEEPSTSKPVFDGAGYKRGTLEKDRGNWKGQGDWEEDWGETYSRKRRPTLFVVNIDSGEVRAAEGIQKSLSVGQVVWAPSSMGNVHRYLIFVGWSSIIDSHGFSRKLGIKYCYNRPCALYAVRSPFQEIEDEELESKSVHAHKDLLTAIKLTQGISSSYFPRVSPDGKLLVFLSAKSAVESGAHCATNSIHRIEWPSDGKPNSSMNVVDVVSVVASAEDGCFPGLYCLRFLTQPWLSDGVTMVLSSIWGSVEVILCINVLSGEVSRITPADSSQSWNVLAIDEDNVLAVCSSPIDLPQLKYGCPVYGKGLREGNIVWNWLDISSPFSKRSEKVKSLLSEHSFKILKIPVSHSSENLTEGSKKPFEAIFVSSPDSKDSDKPNQGYTHKPLIVLLHGGPHSVSLCNYSKSVAFLSSLGFNLFIINYRGSLGFGEDALQSLPGKVGSQDVNDVLTAVDHILAMGLADSSKIAVLGGSHGGFLTTHLIGQAPNRFTVAAVRNPVCNLSLMVGTTDIPDWCYVETCGRLGKDFFTEAPSVNHLNLFYSKSPIAHISKVKTPLLLLLGAQDLRVPVSNGLQYARALKEKGLEMKLIVFPDDIHGIERPQSDFESFINIAMWFRKHCK